MSMNYSVNGSVSITGFSGFQVILTIKFNAESTDVCGFVSVLLFLRAPVV